MRFKFIRGKEGSRCCASRGGALESRHSRSWQINDGAYVDIAAMFLSFGPAAIVQSNVFPVSKLNQFLTC